MSLGLEDEGTSFNRPSKPQKGQKAQVDLRKWQEARERRQHKMEYTTAVARLTELIDGNRTLPAHLRSVHVVGGGNIRESFLRHILSPYLAGSSTMEDVSTLKDVLRTTAAITHALEKTDAFSVIGPSITQSDSIYASPDDVELHIRLKQKSRFMAKTTTEFGNNEGSASVTSTIRSLFGGAETLSANVAFGTRTRRALNISLSAPLVRLDPYVNTWGHFSLFSYENDLTGSSSCVIHEEGCKAWITKSHGRSKHELGYEVSRRTIGSLTSHASLSIREDAGSSIKSALVHNWTYDSRDDSSGIKGTSGCYLKTAQELAGKTFGGDASHYKAISEAQISRRLAPGLTLSLGCRAGFLYPFGENGQSLFPDRLFLGGPTNVRMFRERGMGPQHGSDALGGELMWASGISLIGDIPRKGHWPVKWHTFLNLGRLDHYRKNDPLASQLSSSLQKPSVTVGFGLVYKFEPVRVELSLGVPLIQSRGERTRRGLQAGIGVEFL